jgi:hypothetical protein
MAEDCAQGFIYYLRPILSSRMCTVRVHWISESNRQDKSGRWINDGGNDLGKHYGFVEQSNQKEDTVFET